RPWRRERATGRRQGRGWRGRSGSCLTSIRKLHQAAAHALHEEGARDKEHAAEREEERGVEQRVQRFEIEPEHFRAEGDETEIDGEAAVMRGAPGNEPCGERQEERRIEPGDERGRRV